MTIYHTFRMKPDQDLVHEIERCLAEEEIQAGAVVTCVGSLSQAVLRLADDDKHSTYPGPFEIINLCGTVSVHGSHLHLSLSDQEGHTLGGHLVPGNTVYTTAEIVLVSFPEMVYRREMCHQSGYPELVVEQRKG